MKNLFKKVVAVSFGSSPFFLPQIAFADTACPQGSTGANFGKLCHLSIGTTIGTLVSLFFVLAALIALAYLIWGGFKWITSGGDKSAVETARNHIIAAVVGLIIIFLSYVILNVVLQFFFGVNLLTNFALPTLPG